MVPLHPIFRAEILIKLVQAEEWDEIRFDISAFGNESFLFGKNLILLVNCGRNISWDLCSMDQQQKKRSALAT